MVWLTPIANATLPSRSAERVHYGLTKQPESLERWSQFAQAFTVTVAVASGVLWILTAIIDEPGWVDTLSSILIAGVMVGGVSMGVLYAIRRMTTGR